MRAFTDVKLLTILLFVLVVCTLLNLRTTYVIAEWGYGVGLKLLQDVVAFVRHAV